MTINNSNRTRQATWVAISSFCSFLVGFISPMILSRYFDVGDYGTYKQVMYVYNTLLVVFTLGLPKAYAYFIPRVPLDETKSLIDKITAIFVILGLLFSLFLFFCSGIIADILGNQDLEQALKIFAPVPLFLLPTMGLDGIYASFAKTHVLVLYTVTTKVLTLICIIVPVIFFHGDYIDSIIGFGIASLCACVIALYMRKWPVRNERKYPTKVKYGQILKFSLPLLYASLWGTVIASVGQFFISRYYGNKEFAEFSNGFMENPFVGMIIGGITTVLLPAFSSLDSSEKSNKDEICHLWLSSLEKSAKVLFPMLIFSVIFSELIMVCMYGDLYVKSAGYFTVKNIGGLFYIIPFSPIIIAINKVKDYASVHMIIAFLSVLLSYMAVNLFDNPLMVAVVVEICNVIKILLLMNIIAKYLSIPLYKLIPAKRLGVVLGASMVAGIVTYSIIGLFSLNKFIMLFICLCVFLLAYYICCWLMGITYKQIFSSIVKKLEHSRIIKIIP